MSGLVVDASVVVAWLFDDEDEPRADKALERLAEDGALVPQLWHLETRNALLTAERRGRLLSEDVTERLDALKGLPIATDEEPDLQAAFELARPMGCPCTTLYTWNWPGGRVRNWQRWTGHSAGPPPLKG